MAAGQLYRGVVVPMVSPFTPAGRIDEPAVGRIVDALIAGGANGIFVLGTTGESASIPPEDRRRLAAASAAAVKGRCALYAGISGNCFAQSVEEAVAYKAMAVDAVVAHPPFYYPINDAEMEAYFRRLADSAPLPLVLYNIPLTTHHTIAIDVIARLQNHGNIKALKDSAGDAARLADLLSRLGGRGGFPVLLGNSTQFTHGLKCGGVGVIPSGAHLVPELYARMFEAAMKNQWPDVERLQGETDRVCAQYLKDRTLGQGLAMLKVLLAQRGLCGTAMLPPLREAGRA